MEILETREERQGRIPTGFCVESKRLVDRLMQGGASKGKGNITCKIGVSASYHSISNQAASKSGLLRELPPQ